MHLLTNVNKRLPRNFSLLKSENIKENVKRTGVGYASRNHALLFFGKTPKQTKKDSYKYFCKYCYGKNMYKLSEKNKKLCLNWSF